MNPTPHGEGAARAPAIPSDVVSASVAPRSSVRALRVAVDRFRRVRRPRTPAELGADLVAQRQVIDLLELEFARDAAAFAATDEYDLEGPVSPEMWLAHHCHMKSSAPGTRSASARWGRRWCP